MNENIKVISKRLTVLGAAALMLGTAAFTALPAAENGITAYAATQSTSALKIDKTEGTVGVGEWFYVNVTDGKEGTINQDFTWTSSNEQVATVNYYGNIYANKTGIAVITAADKNGNKVSCKLTVKAAPKKLTLNKTSLTMGIGEQYTITSSVNNGAASSERRFYLGGNDYAIEQIPTSWNYKFKAVRTGEVRINAQTYNSCYAHCDVKVLAAPKSISFNKKEITVGIGETVELSTATNSGSAAMGRTYTSGNKTIAEIIPTSWNCKFKAKKAGTTYINVKTYNGKTARCKVTVKPAPTKVTVTKTSLTLGVGEKASIGSNINSGSCSTKRTYRSSNNSIVKMTKTNWTGEFTAVKPGTAWVTVKTHNGKEASCKITVKPAPTKVSLNKKTITLKVGQTAKVSAYLNSGAASNKRTYRTYDSSIIKMTKTNWEGQFKALRPGVTYVSVTTHNGKKAYCKVIVSGAEKGTNKAKELKLVELINDKRTANGVDPLVCTGKLTIAARAKSNEMISYDQLTTDSPKYGDIGTFLQVNGVIYGTDYTVGSVMVYDGYTEADKLISRAYNDFKDRLLDANVKKIGVGYSYAGQAAVGKTVWGGTWTVFITN